MSSAQQLSSPDTLRLKKSSGRNFSAIPLRVRPFSSWDFILARYVGPNYDVLSFTLQVNCQGKRAENVVVEGRRLTKECVEKLLPCKNGDRVYFKNVKVQHKKNKAIRKLSGEGYLVMN